VPASDRACTPVQPQNFHGKEGGRSSSDSGFPVSNRLSSVPGSESAARVSTKLRAFGCDLRRRQRRMRLVPGRRDVLVMHGAPSRLAVVVRQETADNDVSTTSTASHANGSTWTHSVQPIGADVRSPTLAA